MGNRIIVQLHQLLILHPFHHWHSRPYRLYTSQARFIVRAIIARSESDAYVSTHTDEMVFSLRTVVSRSIPALHPQPYSNLRKFRSQYRLPTSKLKNGMEIRFPMVTPQPATTAFNDPFGIPSDHCWVSEIPIDTMIPFAGTNRYTYPGEAIGGSSVYGVTFGDIAASIEICHAMG